MDDAGMRADEFEHTDPVATPTEGVVPADAQLFEPDEVQPAVEPEADVSVSDEELPETEPVVAEHVSTAEPAQATLDEMVASIAADAAAPEPAQGEGVENEAPADRESSTEESPAEDVGSEPDEAEASEEAVAAEAEAEAPVPGDVPDAPTADETVAAAQADSEPEPEPEPALEPEKPKPLTLRFWTRVPLWIEFGVFVAFAGALTYLLWSAPREALTTLPLYALLVLGGTALVVIDLVTGLAIWLTARKRATDSEKIGLGRTLWLRALGWTAGCVAVWWIAFLVLDLHRIGVIG